MRIAITAFVGMVLLGAALTLFADGAVVDHWSVWRWVHGADVQPWPRIEHQALSIRLDPPGGFAARGRLQLSGVTGDRVALLLDRDLDVDEARVDGQAVDVTHGFGLGARLHREGRVVFVMLPDAPTDGRVTLELAWSGEGEHGTEGSDWRGMLFVGRDEARMCEQTVFCPQVPSAPDGPGVQRAPFTLEVEAPAAWELYASGVSQGPPEPRGDHRLWRFASELPGLPNLVGGRRVRSDALVGDTRVVTLLREEHAALAEPFALDAARMLADYTAEYGPGRAGALCVFEQTCRSDSSYNWAAEGLVVFDRGALGDRVPLAKLAHEVAHLWWGKTVSAAGDGERFLTEGFSDASSWWWLESAGQEVEARRERDAARGRMAKVYAQGGGVPLRDVVFATRHYEQLAYDLGGLVHRYVLGSLDAPARRAFLADYRARGEAGPVSVDDWLAALRAADPGLAVPWVDHGGDVEVALAQVHHDPLRKTLELVVTARARPEDDAFPLALRVGVEVLGRHSRRRSWLDLRGPETRVTLDLGAADPAAEARAGAEPPVAGSLADVAWVQLDPDDLLPLGVQGDPLVVLDGPTLVASQPGEGSEVAFGLGRIVLEFDRPIEPFTVEQYVDRRPALPPGARTPRLLDVASEDGGRRLVLGIQPLAPDRAWVLPLRGALRGPWGSPPVQAWLRFGTGPSSDHTPPRIVRTDPPPGAAGVSTDLARVVVEFDETMQAGVGFRNSTVQALRSDGFGYPEMDFGWWDEAGRAVSFPITHLDPGVEYVLPIGYPLRDLSGNVPERFDLHFSTAPAPDSGG